MAGFYTISDIGAFGGVNNDASSITIPDGWEVALYDGDNFSDSSWVLTADDNCYTDNEFDDMVSSMISESGEASPEEQELYPGPVDECEKGIRQSFSAGECA